MTKTTESCGVKGCDYTYSHINPIVVRRVIGYHKRRVHGIRGKTAAYYEKKKKREKRLAQPPILLPQKTSQPVEAVSVENELTVRELVNDLRKVENVLVALMTLRKVS